MPASWKNVWSDAPPTRHLAQVAAVGVAQHLGEVLVAVGVHVRHRVRRADHVEVDVGVDALALGPVERPDVAARAEQAELLRRPERHAHPRARRVRPDRLGGLDQGGVAAAVVVDARARPRTESRWPPAITTWSLAPARRLGDHVLGAAGARDRVDAHGRAAAVAVGTERAAWTPRPPGSGCPVAASVPLGTPRLLLTSSWMTSAAAPARSAFCALTREKHSPRSTSGIWPARARRSRRRRSRGPTRAACPSARPEPE